MWPRGLTSEEMHNASTHIMNRMGLLPAAYPKDLNAWYCPGAFDLKSGTWQDCSGNGNTATLSGAGLAESRSHRAATLDKVICWADHGAPCRSDKPAGVCVPPDPAYPYHICPESYPRCEGASNLGSAGGVWGQCTTEGHGATKEVLALAGTTSSVIDFGPVIQDEFTLCSVTRYAGDVKHRILNGGGANWLHGHHAGKAGVAFYEGWKTSAIEGSVSPNTDWLVMCGTNAGSQLTLANGIHVGTAKPPSTHSDRRLQHDWWDYDYDYDYDYDTPPFPPRPPRPPPPPPTPPRPPPPPPNYRGGVSLFVNGGWGNEKSEFEIAEVIVWPRFLTSEEMHRASAHLMSRMGISPPNP